MATTEPVGVTRNTQPGPVTDLRPREGVLVLSGYGLYVDIERGQLQVGDGVGRLRRAGSLNRATCGLTRLVVLGHSGVISFEALRWLHDIGASFVQLDADGEVIVASGPRGLDDARLRRAQALAASNGTGIAIARELLEQKLLGQAEVLARLPGSDDAITAIHQHRAKLADANTPARLRVTEAHAAAAYWAAWAPVGIRFARRDQKHIPTHWQTFGTRSSSVSGVTRNASNPINALLNYVYAILETEVRLAVLTMGLDPGMGVHHADLASRDSFVHDVMEPLRPVADGYVLTLLKERSFAAKEFFETRQGVCRLMPPLPQALAEMASRLAKVAAPVVEQVAQRLALGSASTAKPLIIPTLLTQANRSAGRDNVRTSAPRETRPIKLEAPSACRECGVILENPSRQYCEDCLLVHRASQAASFSNAGRAKLQQLRASGIDPSQTGAAAEKRRAVMKQRRKEELKWDAAYPDLHVDEAAFAREIVPHLQSLPLSVISKHTGLSQQYCSLIRRGLYIPHPRHWDALRNLMRVVDSEADDRNKAEMDR